MKSIKLGLLSVLILATSTNRANNYNYTKFSKDLAIAYTLSFGLTLIHELGHALTAKFFYGKPIDITLGTHALQKSKFPIKFAGFNPFIGFALCDSRVKYHPLKQATISLAGPLSGTTASFAAIKFLRPYKTNLPMTNCVAIMSFVNDTASGIEAYFFNQTNHDVIKAGREIKKYLNLRKNHSDDQLSYSPTRIIKDLQEHIQLTIDQKQSLQELFTELKSEQDGLEDECQKLLIEAISNYDQLIADLRLELLDLESEIQNT